MNLIRTNNNVGCYNKYLKSIIKMYSKVNSYIKQITS